MTAETALHLTEISKIVGPFLYVIGVLCGVIVTLLIWAWKKMEKSIDKIELTLANYIKDDDALHDQLFELQRGTDARLNTLIGQHEVYHG